MKGLKDFCIPFSSLKLGDNIFQNKIDKSFFEAFNYSNPHDCKINVSVNFKKEVHLMYIHLKYEGITNIDCDRCLEKMQVEIQGDFNSVLKFDHIEDVVTKNEVIYLPYDCHEFNIAPVLYEHYLLNFPKRNIHPTEKCNVEQLNLVLKYTNNENSNSETNDHDPRWEALKVLKNKNKK